MDMEVNDTDGQHQHTEGAIAPKENGEPNHETTDSPTTTNSHADSFPPTPKPIDLGNKDDSSCSIANDESTPSRDVVGRLKSIETKFNVLETLFNPQVSEDESEDSDYSGRSSDSDGSSYGSRRVLGQVLWYIGRSKRLYEREQRMKKHRKAMRRADSRNVTSDNRDKTNSLENISTAANLRGEPAVLQWVAWKYFIAFKGGFENSVLMPIDAVVGEPEPHIILQLKIQVDTQAPRKRPSGGRPRPAARTKIPEDLPGQLPLPERVKIHSESLNDLFMRIITAHSTWRTAADGSIVFLRPYREFIYYENELRGALANLEKHVESAKISDSELVLLNKEDAHDLDPKATVGKTDESIQKTTSTGDDNETEEVQQGGDEDDSASVKAEEEYTQSPMTTLLHLRCLMRFIDEELKPKIEYINNNKCRKILFHDLWYLLKPGNEVIDQKEKQAYRIVRVEFPRHKVEEPFFRWNKRPSRNRDDEAEIEEDTLVRVHCAYIDFDGKQFGPVSKKFDIAPYGGVKDIKSLPVYPLRFAKDTKLRERLIKRGRMLLDISRYKSMYYSGYTLDSRDEVDSQVVVDFSEALSDETRENWAPVIDTLRTAPDTRDDVDRCVAPCCHGQAVGEDEYIDSRLTEDFFKSLIPDTSFAAPSLLLSPRPLDETQIGSENEPTEDEFVVMTYRVFGFVLRSRKWAQLDLTFLRYENTDARVSTLSAFDQLELPEGHRDMVKSLVTQHFRERQATFARDEQTDLIKGKGKGLILLLHGAPGVGKTTTAEGIAELFQKPLFQITCGDLGSTARDVEVELEKNFALASRWGCILLLDEADVFLSARERKDFERNGLVAVFLRVLEYYAGILFLTTNRIGDFDEAFASRIHMSLHYPELDEAKTIKIFDLNLDLIQQRFKRQDRTITYDASAIKTFAAQHYDDHEYNRWNGRQIRNLCQTALALAEFDAHGRKIDGKVDKEATVQLQLKHFALVQKAYIEFGEYLGDLRGTPGDQRAYDHSLRAKQGTVHQTTPSKFSRSSKAKESSSNARHSSSIPQSQSSAHIDQFQPLVNQGYLPGASPNTRPVYNQPHSSGQTMGSMGNSYDLQHGYPHQGIQQGQMDPRFYQGHQPQQAPQSGYIPQGQGWVAPNMPMNYNPTSQPQQMQPLQGQGLPGQLPPYGYSISQGGVQSNTVGGPESFGQTVHPGESLGGGSGSGVGSS
ncbi:hypothetical protein P153DRAFT_367415 [Dothidotthia symphoricarpi CBS 119687]|uniref:AAA+ ATPase domain-containing protein n=1 Tax=Dothidotthia symphoricarpi CBS 119687 TaxID=1392245 RepID=A0A6A6ABF1_9PLEO|nr:uncharacterized protein P153DRAFT_367415 [Dothidotthia symphoricarpi CBS 119687]KAF2129150.1 hypothetical protein P153DRAFT_367415 [Dothidotthia symphoricarpi CBS 119687]